MLTCFRVLVERELHIHPGVRVVQFHHADEISWGGAIVAMHRLHVGLRRAGVDSQILCSLKTLDSPHTHVLQRPRLVEALLKRVTSRLGLNDIHCVGSFGIRNHPAFRAADVVHIHGTHSGHLSYLALPGMTRRKPMALTLHDMWSFTGHCAYSYGCERWKAGCGSCPHLDAVPAVRRDATALEWRLKRWVYGRAPLTIVTLSDWITTLARQSLLARFPIHQIPNGIDTEVYRPLDRGHCRSLLGIPPDRKVLMWLAARLDPAHHEGRRKGADLLLAALRRLPESIRGDVLLLLVGKNGERVAEMAGLPSLNLGFVASDHLKAIAYSAADLLLFPTRADNMPLVLLESLACGTPMVSVRVGGVPDIVRQGVTGYLAAPEDAADFAAGIVRLLEDDGAREAMGRRCRAIAVDEYSIDLHVRRHVDLYRSMAGLAPASAVEAAGGHLATAQRSLLGARRPRRWLRRQPCPAGCAGADPDRNASAAADPR
ncbi:MAG: glycosyltransferase [Candidatus Rokuibacteriota bacterium]